MLKEGCEEESKKLESKTAKLEVWKIIRREASNNTKGKQWKEGKKPLISEYASDKPAIASSKTELR